MEFFLSLGIVIPFFVFASIYLHCFRTSKPTSRLYNSFPLYGRRDEFFSTFRLYLRGFSAGKQLEREGYHQYNKKGKSFLSLDQAFRPHILLPQEHISWLADQPSSLLCRAAVQKERFASKYFLPPLNREFENITVDIFRQDVTRNLVRMQPVLFEEMRQSIDANWGVDETSWLEINLYSTMETIIYRTLNLILVGSPLCRDEAYIRALKAWAMWFGTGALIIGQMAPQRLRPLIAPLIGIFYHMYRARCQKFLLPLIKERLEYFKRKKTDPSLAEHERNDLITWMSRAVVDSPAASTLPFRDIADQFLYVTVTALQTSMAVATHTFLDLLSSRPELGYYQSIREEAAAVFKTKEDWGNSALLARLPLGDSTIRESLRHNPVIGQGLLREVMARDGIDMPDGHHLDQGTWIGISVLGLHSDDRFYSNPDKYEPFRFVKKKKEPVFSEIQPTPPIENGGTNTDADKASDARKNLGLATTSDIFLGFGYGRGACPGRFIAAHQLKMMLAYIALNYDIQPLDQRPLNSVFGDLISAPRSATIKVRRRRVV